MNMTIKTKSGRVYKRAAWTGGCSPPLNIQEINKDWQCLYSFFLKEQFEDFSAFWDELPDEDTRKIFENRAKFDAWATLRETFGKTDNNLCSDI